MADSMVYEKNGWKIVREAPPKGVPIHSVAPTGERKGFYSVAKAMAYVKEKISREGLVRDLNSYGNTSNPFSNGRARAEQEIANKIGPDAFAQRYLNQPVVNDRSYSKSGRIGKNHVLWGSPDGKAFIFKDGTWGFALVDRSDGSEIGTSKNFSSVQEGVTYWERKHK